MALIAQVLKASGVCPSTSEALRMIEQGGVRVNGEKVERQGAAAGGRVPPTCSRSGKRKFAKVTLRPAA